MNKKLLTILLSVLLPVFLVGAVVSATTSIGDDITVSSGMRIGEDSTPGDITALENDSLFVEGKMEVDGAAYFDGAVDMDSTLDVAGATTLSGEVATGLTLSGVNSMAGLSITGATLLGASADMNIDHSSIGNDYGQGLDVDLQQTGEVSGETVLTGRGGMIGVRGDVHVAYTIDDAYGVYGKVFIDPAEAEEVNQLVGVFGWVEIKGTLTAAGTGPISALRAEISNGSTGSFTGMVFGLDISYGSNVNYGGETAGVRVYTHADAKMDYGYYVKNYSSNMVNGLYLANSSNGTMTSGIELAGPINSYTQGIYINETTGTTNLSADKYAIRANTYYPGGDVSAYGMYVNIQQTAETSGSLGSRGNMMGVRGDVHVANTIDDAYGVYGKVFIDPAEGEEVNQLAGVFGWVRIKGTLTAAGTGPISALRAEISNESTGSFTGMVFGLDISYGSNVDYDGETAGVRVYTHADAKMDYGYYVKNYSSNMVSGLLINNQTTGTMTSGIDLTNTGSGVMTHGIRIAGTVGIGIDMSGATISESAIILPTTSAPTCDGSNNQGGIYFDGTNFYGCGDGNSWRQLDFTG